MKLPLSTFLAGLIFGMGLTISQMVNPEKVISFLDISGDWDPSLAFVMGGALLTTFFGYRFVLKKSSPLFSEKFRLPTSRDIDKPLIIGASLFGVGTCGPMSWTCIGKSDICGTKWDYFYNIHAAFGYDFSFLARPTTF